MWTLRALCNMRINFNCQSKASDDASDQEDLSSFISQKLQVSIEMLSDCYI